MFEAERQHMKSVDKEILEASGDALKKLQELDRTTQLSRLLVKKDHPFDHESERDDFVFEAVFF